MRAGNQASLTQTKTNMKRKTSTQQSLTRVRLQQEKDGTFSFLSTTSDEVYKGGMKNMKEVERIAKHNKLEIVFDATATPAPATAPSEPTPAPASPAPVVATTATPKAPKAKTKVAKPADGKLSKMGRIDQLLTDKTGHTIAEIVKTIVAEFPGAAEKATLSSVRTRRYDVRKAIEAGTLKATITVKDEPKAAKPAPAPKATTAPAKVKKVTSKGATAFPRDPEATVTAGAKEPEPAAA